MSKLLYEIKKNPVHPKVLLVIVVAFLFINGVVVNYWISRYTADKTPEYQEGYDAVYNLVEGEITLEHMEWIISEKERLNEIILGGQFSTEEGQSGTYTGYIYSDNNLFNDLYDNAKYAYEYASYAQSIANKAESNAMLYEEKGALKLARQYWFMSEQFAGRSIAFFYRTNGWEEYLSYEFSNLPVLLLIMMCFSSLFSQERETGMSILLKITPSGIKRARLHKVATAFAFTWAFTTLFSLQDLLLFGFNYKLRGFKNPIYSIPVFQQTLLKVDIGSYVLINYLLKLIGMWFFTALVLLCSVRFKSNMLAFGGSVGVLIGGILVNAFVPLASFIPLLNSINIFSRFDVIDVCGVCVPQYLWQTVFVIILCIVCILLVYVFDAIGNKLRGGGNDVTCY